MLSDKLTTERVIYSCAYSVWLIVVGPLYQSKFYNTLTGLLFLLLSLSDQLQFSEDNVTDGSAPIKN